MLIYGHRGSPWAHPENTLASFRAAIGAGCNGIEFDVQKSMDNVPVVIHDRLLERTTNGTGSVVEFTWEQLQALEAGAGEPIPSLAQVLALAYESVHLDIEVKCQGAEGEILETIGSRPLDTWAISSFDWTVLRTFRELRPDIDLWVLTMAVTDEAIEEARLLRASTLAVNHESFDAASAGKVARAGLSVMAWTVNQVDELHRLGALGVQAICTDVPADMLGSLS